MSDVHWDQCEIIDREALDLLLLEDSAKFFVFVVLILLNVFEHRVEKGIDRVAFHALAEINQPNIGVDDFIVEPLARAQPFERAAIDKVVGLIVLDDDFVLAAFL